MLIFLLQVGIPTLLLQGALQSSSRIPVYLTQAPGNFCTPIWTGESQSPFELGALLMNLAIVLVHAIKIAPRVLNVFFQTIGEG